MEEKLKERVFGGVILIALAVIVLPMLFDRTVKDRIQVDQTIPTPPLWSASEAALQPSTRLALLEDVDMIPDQSAASSEPPTATLPTAEPMPASTAVPPSTSGPSSGGGNAVTSSVPPENNTAAPTAAVVAPPPTAAPTAVAPSPAIPTAAVAPPRPASNPAPVLPKSNVGAKTQPALKSPLMAYTVQVGHFESRANAKKLADTLKKAGYTAYVSDYKAQGKVLAKVMVGPSASRLQAEKTASRLASQLQIKGFVVPYNPKG